MKITGAKHYLTTDGGRNAVFLKLETDAGLTGYGEATINFLPQACFGMLKDLTPELIGEDPERVEYLWQACFRRRFYRGGPATGAAISAIDMALWDIKGKAYGVPVYQLLGGLARRKVRLYGHVTGRTASEIAERARLLAEKGITAIRYRGFHSYDDVGLHDHQLAVKQQVEYTEAIRAAVGDDVDLLLECHGRYDPEWAIELARQVERFHPFMIEDPIRHENPQAMAVVRAHIRLPIATGERYHNKWEFRETIVNRYVDYLRPDVCHCGGITEMRKIAALGETYFMQLIPHNNAGPIGTAASLHASLAIPNVVLMEAPFAGRDPKVDVARPYPEVVDGYALPLEGPGLGVELDEALAASKSFNPARLPQSVDALDGAVRDY